MTLIDRNHTRVDQRVKCEGERIFYWISTNTRTKLYCILINIELILDTTYLLGGLQGNNFLFLKFLLCFPWIPLIVPVSTTVVNWKLFICVICIEIGVVLRLLKLFNLFNSVLILAFFVPH